MKAPAVVLLSGGLDSCVTTTIAARSHSLALLHLDYGQRTRKGERAAFCRISDFYSVPPERRLIVDADSLVQIGGSALTDPDLPVPEADLHRRDIPPTYVPFRNAHLLCLAVSWAEVIGAGAVYIGVVEEDSSGYPDCTEAFCTAFAEAVAAGTRPETQIQILTPLIHRSKTQIVQEGTRLGAPLHLTWSCYSREDIACGRCDSCALRLRAFRDAGITDPIPYVSS